MFASSGYIDGKGMHGLPPRKGLGLLGCREPPREEESGGGRIFQKEMGGKGWLRTSEVPGPEEWVGGLAFLCFP